MTGAGTGFIGSFMTLRLLSEGYQVVVMDNLYNSSAKALDRIELLCGRRPVFYNVDLCERERVFEIFHGHKIDAVVHFAGLKSVGESVSKPLFYYRNNLGGTINLLEAMLETGCNKIVFSSSCTVYGHSPSPPPWAEDNMRGPRSNPYGETKSMLEQILADVCVAHRTFSAVILRYFNPAGAHESGLLGEDPRGAPGNLIPVITRVAAGLQEKVSVFGNDWNTTDGT